jgi:hypothetical protein
VQPNWAKGVGINLGVPVLGIGIFILLCRKMQRERVKKAPYLAFFILFFCLGGWIMVALTAFFWVWSGLASLGAGFFILFSPMLVGVSTLAIRSKRKLSGYHKVAFVTGVSYITAVSLLDIGLLVFHQIRH